MTVAARVWRAGEKTIALQRPIVVAIVNVTPDSFSDGGRTFSFDAAVAHGIELAATGADVLDVGGESTRPGATSVAPDEEIRRVVPVIEALRAELPDVPLSVDTVKSSVAEAALAAGADIVNDVSAFRLDQRMAGLCGRAGCGVVLMHSRGSVAEMASYANAEYGDDVTAEVMAELAPRIASARRAGVANDSIVLDPGFGFSKRTEHSLTVLRDLPRIVQLGYPVLAGVSRKRMIGELTGVTEPAARDAGTAGVNVYALVQGARLFRVHNAPLARQSLDAAWQAMRGRHGGDGGDGGDGGVGGHGGA